MILIISIILTVLYILLVSWYIFGWHHLKYYHKKLPKEAEKKFSIIVPARNEAEHIENTILDLAAQDYPATHFEVLIMNDASDDGTLELAEGLIEGKSLTNFRIVTIADEIGASKKNAITQGVRISKFEWIVTTDADCRRGKKWLSTMASFVVDETPVFVSAPVVFHKEATLFAKIQSLEFMSLIGIGASCIQQKHPTLCNGANMAFTKSVFTEVEGYKNSNHIASGDDEFLLHKVAGIYPGRISFLKHYDSIVFTEAKPTLKDFFNQRKRWVSKSTDYKNPSETIMIWLVWLMHLCLLTNLLLSPFSLTYLLTFFITFSLKLLIEFIFILPVSRFFTKISLLPYYPLAAFFYVFYVALIPFAAKLSSFEWKGRKYQSNL